MAATNHTGATKPAEMMCDLYRGAFSGEVVFSVQLAGGQTHQGIAPKHYAKPSENLTNEPTSGTVRVRLIRNGGTDAFITTPSGEAITVPATVVSY